MNDKDLIRRGDAEEARDELVRVLNYINTSGTLDYADYCELFDTIERVFNALKAVPQEMTAREYTVAREKMCDSFYPCDEGCPIWDFMRKRGESSCPDFEASHPFDFIAIVEKWAREHPEVKDER